MFKKIHVALASAVLMAGLVSAPAFAAKAPVFAACDASTETIGNAGYVSCLGAFEGNMDNQLSAIYSSIQTGFGLSTNTYFSSHDVGVTAGNPFLADAGATDNGTITFTAAQTGSFVIGLKQADVYSLYRFNGAAVAGGITSIKYDVLGVTGKTGYNLSHAGFFGTPVSPVSPVPEADTYAMLLAGLGIVGFAARRRKAK